MNLRLVGGSFCRKHEEVWNVLGWHALEQFLSQHDRLASASRTNGEYLWKISPC